MRVLVFGGAGYIGSHAALVLLSRGHDVVVADNLSNGSFIVIERLEALSGRKPAFIRIDLRESESVTRLFQEGHFDAVLHFAALKSVGDSCSRPLEYFDNNISGTIQLLLAMQTSGCKRLVFSSSATVYGEPEHVPIDETAPLRITNPYGRSKLVMEELIGDACKADPSFTAINLRYFNPVGAHPSGLIGESPNGVPDNLMPYICQVASGQRESLSVFGDDWPTPDGTGIRDYIHVMDLAEAHAIALERIPGIHGNLALNLGTGKGTSVMELINGFERINGIRIPHRIVGRRPGDVAEAYADPTKAHNVLGWRSTRGVDEMCRDAWNWQRMNPRGYHAPSGNDPSTIENPRPSARAPIITA